MLKLTLKTNESPRHYWHSIFPYSHSEEKKAYIPNLIHWVLRQQNNILIQLLILMVINTMPIAKAMSYFIDFSINKRVLPPDNQIEVTFNYDIPKNMLDRFVIRPKLTNGIVNIFNETTNTWVLGTDIWSKMPKISETMLIQADTTRLEASELFFQLYDTKNTKIYETPKKNLWSRSQLKTYVEKLNSYELQDNDLTIKESIAETSNSTESSFTPNTVQLESSGIVKQHYFLIAFILTIVIGGAVSAIQAKMVSLRNEKLQQSKG